MRKTRPMMLRWLDRVARYAADTRGNTAVLAALVIPGLILSMGASLDYMSAAHREERLNGIADAAALAAVTPSMMLQSDNTKAYPCTSSGADGVPYQTAYNVFNAQAASVANIGNVTPTVCITDVVTGSNIVRTATVHYTSTSTNVFAGVLGFGNMAIQGIASAKSTLSPRTNFYLMIDTSPSMEIPSSIAGINQMVTLTPNEGGCSFACHETNPASGDTNVAGGPDNYTLAQQNCITLRIDLVNDAVNNLLQVAPATAAVNNTVYGISVNTFNVGFTNIFPLTTDFSNLTYSSFTKDGGPICGTTTTIRNI